jgi:hypothetical protein
LKKKAIIENLLKYITYFFEVLPFVFFALNSKSLGAKDKRVFFMYTTLVAIFILTGVITRYYFGSTNNFYLISRLYDVMEYSLLALYFSYNVMNPYVKKFVLYSIIPFIGFCLYDFLTAKEHSFAFLPLVIECLTMLLILIYIFYEKIQYTLLNPIYQTSFFWIAVAFIIYFAGNFFLFLYSKNSFQDEAFRRQYTIIYTTVTISKDILLSIAAFIKEDYNVNKLSGQDPMFSDMNYPDL